MALTTASLRMQLTSGKFDILSSSEKNENMSGFDKLKPVTKREVF